MRSQAKSKLRAGTKFCRPSRKQIRVAPDWMEDVAGDKKQGDKQTVIDNGLFGTEMQRRAADE